MLPLRPLALKCSFLSGNQRSHYLAARDLSLSARTHPGATALVRRVHNEDKPDAASSSNDPALFEGHSDHEPYRKEHRSRFGRLEKVTHHNDQGNVIVTEHVNSHRMSGKRKSTLVESHTPGLFGTRKRVFGHGQDQLAGEYAQTEAERLRKLSRAQKKNKENGLWGSSTD